MKHLKPLVLLTIVLFASAISCLAQSAEAVVAKHLAATGGVANWKKVNNVTMTGGFNAAGTSMEVTLIILQGKGAKMQYAYEGMIGYQIITPKAGWNAEGNKAGPAPEEMPSEQLDDRKFMLDIMPLVDYEAKGTKITYEGKVEIEGATVEKLKLTFAGGKEQIWFFDKKYNHVRTIDKHVLGIYHNNETFIYSNFKKLLEGVVMPMVWESGNDGKLEFKAIEINKGVDESIFVPATK